VLALNEGVRGGGNAEEGTIPASSPGTPLCSSSLTSKTRIFNRKGEGTKAFSDDIRKTLVIYLFFKMMTPRAMLAMREPWERRERRRTKQKVSMTKLPGLGCPPQRNTANSVKLMQNTNRNGKTRVRETDQVGRVSLQLGGGEKLSWVAWEQGCWGQQATRIFWPGGFSLFRDAQCVLQTRTWPNQHVLNREQEYSSTDQLQGSNTSTTPHGQCRTGLLEHCVLLFF